MTLRTIGPIASGACAGGVGVSTANADSPQVVSGLLYAVYIEYVGSPPAGTTDVTIATGGNQDPDSAVTLLSIENAATDGWFFPRQLTVSTANANNTDDYEMLPVNDIVNVKIAQANDADSINVWLVLV
jgi:hypothetical protein